MRKLKSWKTHNLQILKSSSKLLITKAFIGHLIQAESNSDQIQNIIDKFMNLGHIKYSKYEKGSFSSSNCQFQVKDLIVQGIELI